MKRSTILAAALALACAQSVRADAMTLGMCTTDPMVITMNNSMLTLASDIGTMADRILVTENDIGQMADKIVTTENLLSSTLLQLQSNASNGGGFTGGKPGVLLLAPSTGDTVYRSTAPALTLSDNATSYVLYVSTTGNFQDGNVLPLLVTPQTPLAILWQNAVQPLPASTVYIAVKSVYNQGNLSELSNAVRVGLE
jgi:hypothetical protein